MAFYFPVDQQLICSPENVVFEQDLKFLIGAIKPFAKKVDSLNSINESVITSLGDFCLSLSKTKTTHKNDDLLDESKYPEFFSGEFSDDFIDIFKTIQHLWHLSSHLDSYSTLELSDKGVNKKDKIFFQTNVNHLYRKLTILNNKLTKKPRVNTLGMIF